MPNINLTDSRKRDAVVKAENIGVDDEIRYVDSDGKNAYTRKILKATVDHDYDTLVKIYDDDPEKMALALVDGDPEVDMEKCGVFLWGVSKVYVNSDDGIVYRIEQTEIVRDAHGEIKEKRPRRRSESNVDSDIPLTWTGKQIDKAEALRKYVFASKLQIVHVNGLTYDFLYGMASELAENDSLMIVGGGSKGRDPLIFRSGSIPYRGFLEGRVDGDKYILLLHLSNMELKLPSDKPAEQKQNDAADDSKEAKKAPGKEAMAEKVTDKKATEKKPSKKSEEKKDDSVVPKKPVKDKPVKKTATASEPKDQLSNNKNNKEELSDEKSQPETAKEEHRAQTDSDKSTAADQKDQVAEPPPKAEAESASSASVSDAAPVAVTSEDLGVWLKSIRMGKYLPLFIENEIDVDVLPELTDEDLKELDIPVGSRRRLLKAVSATEDLRAEVSMSVRKMAKAPAGKK